MKRRGSGTGSILRRRPSGRRPNWNCRMIRGENSSLASILRTFGAAVPRKRGISRLRWPAAGMGGAGRRQDTTSRLQRGLQCRTLQALQHEGYVGRGELTVISDGAEIMKRLPKVLPKPTTHIIDWFHIAMKIQPLQQMADHVARATDDRSDGVHSVKRDVRSVKWKLWHGQVDRAIDRLERIEADLVTRAARADATAKRMLDLARALLTYIRSGQRIASSLAESAVNSLVARRMVKKQQMQWSPLGAHRLLQVRAAVLNGDLNERLAWQPPEPDQRYRGASMLEPTRPLLKAA